MSLSYAVNDTTDRTSSAVATLSMWVGHPGQGFVDLSSPTFVARPIEDDETTSSFDLRELGYAYQATSVSFAPAGGWTSVTLLEELDTCGRPKGARYELDRCELLDLFTIGWAARIGAITFHR